MKLLLALVLACAGCSSFPRTVRLDVYAADSAAGGFVAPARYPDAPSAIGRGTTRVLSPVTGARVSCPTPCRDFLETTEGGYEIVVDEPDTPIDFVDVRVERPGFEPLVVHAPLRYGRVLVLLSPKGQP